MSADRSWPIAPPSARQLARAATLNTRPRLSYLEVAELAWRHERRKHAVPRRRRASLVLVAALGLHPRQVRRAGRLWRLWSGLRGSHRCYTVSVRR